ncbi:uncharacterized protein LOC115325546 [Ixodes scapularis]|uniref:uncharacterized protein LOC115325546 n=1 Tax=Ixodes scapularis TaxID=6945 RepID=UPI001A9DF4CC|nr:uncharacterized protein LOC115325546 [Ixodes scapularis]
MAVDTAGVGAGRNHGEEAELMGVHYTKIYFVSARIYLFKPREAMFVFFFLGILLLHHSDASLLQKRKGDYPDANEVIQKLPQTYMLQSVENYSDLTCGYQVFYSGTYGNKTYSNYDLFFLYMDGSLFNQPLYIRNVTGYIITMSIEPGALRFLLYGIRLTA